MATLSTVMHSFIYIHFTGSNNTDTFSALPWIPYMYNYLCDV